LRFAEIKTRLFIFFAGRLLRWAKSIELEMTNGQSPPAILVDDSNVLFAEPSHEREAVSGPPEHWARLVAKSPPQHWLDLVRDKAPQLLPPSEGLVPVAQAEVESFKEEEKAERHQDAEHLPAGAEERSGSRALSPTKQGRRDTRHSTAKAKRSIWLDRIRFQASVRRAESADPYVSNSRTRDSDSFLAAGGAAEKGSESSLQQPTLNSGDAGAWSPEPETNTTIPGRRITSRVPGHLLFNTRHDHKIDARQKTNRLVGSLSRDPKSDNRLDGLQTVARSGSNSVTREAHAKPYPDRQAGVDYEQGRSDHSESVGWDALSNDDSRQSILKPGKPEMVRNRLHLNRSHTSFERSAQSASGSRGPAQTESIGDQRFESSSAKRRTPLNDLDRAQGGSFEMRERPSSSVSAGHLKTLDQPAAEARRAQSRIKREARQVHDIGQPARTRKSSAAPDSAIMVNNGRVSKQPPSLMNTLPRTEQAGGREFASLPLAARASIEMNAVSNEGLWPVLPPSPKFDVADELAANDQETEALRRLELEQRGTLWNA